jgi:hypothetical protein
MNDNPAYNSSSGKVKLIMSFLLFVFFSNGYGQVTVNPKKPFIDTTDGAFDVSYYLYNLHGFLPIVTPITEPAVGYGAAVAGLFFVPKKEKPGKYFQMPDVIGIGAGYTQNGTWLLGGGYFGFWKNDHIRYRGAGGYGHVNLKYYGRGDGFLDENPAEFTINAWGFIQQATFRIAESRFMLGGNYIFAKTKVTLFEDSKLPFIDPHDFELTNSGISLIAEYENLDNIFSPSSGSRINVTYNQYLEFLGSDRNFGRFTTFAYYYLPVIKYRWTSGFRLDYQMAVDNPPFYAYPFIILRGVPAMRYQGKYLVVGETEQTVNLTRRWSVVAFAGYGQTFFDRITGKTAWNTGGGFRYLIARSMGLRMGIDVARGPEEWAVYMVFGNAWLR